MPMYIDIHEIRGATCNGKKELTSALNTLDHCLMQPRRRIRCDTDWQSA